jgi:hypothetical protein
MESTMTPQEIESQNRRIAERMELESPDHPWLKRYKSEQLAKKHMAEIEAAFPEPPKPSMTTQEYRDAVSTDDTVQEINAEMAAVYEASKRKYSKDGTLIQEGFGQLELSKRLKPLQERLSKRLEELEAGPKVVRQQDSWGVIESKAPGIRSWVQGQGLDGSSQMSVVFRNVLGRMARGEQVTPGFLKKYVTSDAAEQLMPLIVNSMRNLTPREDKLKVLLAEVHHHLGRRLEIQALEDAWREDE